MWKGAANSRNCGGVLDILGGMAGVGGGGISLIHCGRIRRRGLVAEEVSLYGERRGY